MNLPPVEIRFTAAGLPDIDKAFATVEQRLVRMEREGTREAERGSQARVRAARSEAETRERVTANRVKTEEQLEKERTRETERQARYLEGVHRRSSEMAGRLAAQQAREEIREAEKSAREVERLEQQKMRIRIRSSEMAGRVAEQEARAEAAARARVSRGIGAGVTHGLGCTIGTAASLAGGALAIGGGFALADVAGKELAAQQTAALLVNAVTTGKTPPPGANVGGILAFAGAVSRETGMSKQELIAGTLEYSRKARRGDFAGAMANMGFFARMAKTTGTDINEIAAAAGTLQSQNPDLKAPEMQQMLLDVYAQGKAGSMSMIDVAKQIGILSSTRSSFAGNAADNQRKLLALGQLAAPEGTVEEAGTFIKNMSAEAGAHRKSTKDTVGLEQMGVKFDQFGRMESPEQMIAAVFKGTGGDITKIEKIFGLRGTALFRALQPAFAAAGGGEAGVRAVQAKMASVTGATMTSGDLDAQFQQLVSTPAEKFHRALNDVSEVLSERLEPIMARLATSLTEHEPEIERFLSAMMSLADWMIANPFKGLGAIVLADITKDLAAAGIGAATRAAIQALITGSLPGAAGAGLAGGAAAGGVLAAGAAGAGIGFLLSNAWVAHETDLMRGRSSADLATIGAATGLFGKARAGTVTAADIAAAQEMATKLKSQVASAQQGVVAADRTSFLPWVGEKGKLDAAAELKRTEDSLKLLQRAIAAASSGLHSLGSTAANTDPNHPGRSAPIDRRPP